MAGLDGLQVKEAVLEWLNRFNDILSGEVLIEDITRLLLTFLIGYIVLATMWRIRQTHPLAIIAKVRMYSSALVFLCCSTDKKVPKRKVAEVDLTSTGINEKNVVSRKKKTMIFIRHGESTWNDTFNKSKLPWYFLPRLIYAWLYELSLIFVKDSWFFDSPLSPEGIQEALVLRAIISKKSDDTMIQTLAGIGDFGKKSIVVSSPLRRAVSTVAIALHDRLRSGEEKIRLLSSLQEVSFNPDTLCLAAKGNAPVASWILKEATTAELHGVDAVKIYTNHIDPSSYVGQKELRPSNGGLKRIKEFAKWCFEAAQDDAETIIVGGHSLYFKYFFKQYVMDGTPNHISQLNKMHNCAAIKFEFEELQLKRGDATVTAYRVVPASLPDDHSKVKYLYKGFMDKSGKKKRA
jgi:hypothetical protein